MIICDVDKRFERFESAVETIANAYAMHLHNKAMFEWKLEQLDVVLLPVSSQDKLTSGLCMKNDDNLSIYIFVNESNPEDYIKFVIAHEFGHLLFKKMTDLLSVTGKANDGSTELTSIVRITQDSKQYGRELEEQVCDILAIYILNKMGITEFSDFTLQDLQKSARKRAVVESFINIFGSPLSDGEFIDDYEKRKDGCNTVKNSFWYCAVTFGLVQIINIYDETMGQDAYQNFCNLLSGKNITMLDNELKRFQRLVK